MSQHAPTVGLMFNAGQIWPKNIFFYNLVKPHCKQCHYIFEMAAMPFPCDGLCFIVLIYLKVLYYKYQYDTSKEEEEKMKLAITDFLNQLSHL